MCQDQPKSTFNQGRHRLAAAGGFGFYLSEKAFIQTDSRTHALAYGVRHTYVYLTSAASSPPRYRSSQPRISLIISLRAGNVVRLEYLVSLGRQRKRRMTFPLNR